jgi:hypothetical protein
MQGPPTPSEDIDAFIPTEHAVRNRPQLSAGNRKAAKRTFPWELKADEIQLALPRPQDEDDHTRATKRPRLEEPLPTSADEAPTESTQHDTTVALPPPDATAATAAVTESDPVTDTHPIARIYGAPRNSWTPAEDAQLTRAVTKTPKKNRGKEYKLDWVAISAQITDRTNTQCNYRWHRTLDPSIDRANRLTGMWTGDDDNKLKDAVQTHGGKNWIAIAALVPGRTREQCHSRWHKILDPRINPANRRTGEWSEDEDIKLKNAVEKHAGKDWAAIAALVPGRIGSQCYHRWQKVLDARVDRTPGRSGKWTSDEDTKLKTAVHKHGGKHWAAIAGLVPGRTSSQCSNRWHRIQA